MVESRFLDKLASRLFEGALEREAFIDSLENPVPLPSALLWLKDRPAQMPFEVLERLLWQPAFIDRVEQGLKPGANPLHEAGHYYCMDVSSVFSASILTAIPHGFSAGSPLVVDVCSSPGGKGAFAWKSLSPQLIVCNEVIGKRTAALISNLSRCDIQPAMVVSADSGYLAKVFEWAADLVIVDAPCSGQSLLAKGEKSAGCFHPSTINMNSNRQKRIIANSAKVVAPGGYLAYMTCTYSREENEAVVEWLLKRFPWFMPMEVPALASFRSHLAEFPCYRLWPQSKIGAGAFAVLLRSEQEGGQQEVDYSCIKILWKRGI